MLAIHISHDTLKYAQLVNFKGTPFIESLGKVSIKEGLQIPDTSNTEVIRTLGEMIANIRNSAEFPDNSTHIVIDSDWFPIVVHHVDGVLQGSDREKYLRWRLTEMLENAASQYSMIHQELSRSEDLGIEYLTIGIPKEFDNWVENIFSPSELQVKKVILEIQAFGDMLTASGQLTADGGVQVILENRENKIQCHIYQDQEFKGLFQAGLNWDFKLTIDHIRGDRDLVNRVKDALARALKGKQNPDNVFTNLFYFNSTGDPAVLNNLEKYETCCQPLDLVHHFNFRDQDFENVDEYAAVLGALSIEIQERFNEN